MNRIETQLIFKALWIKIANIHFLNLCKKKMRKCCKMMPNTFFWINTKKLNVHNNGNTNIFAFHVFGRNFIPESIPPVRFGSAGTAEISIPAVSYITQFTHVNLSRSNI